MTLPGFGVLHSAMSNGVSDLFATKLFVSGAIQIISTQFTPDLVWQKARSSVSSHSLVDSTRGSFDIGSNTSNNQNSLPVQRGQIVPNGFYDRGFLAGSTAVAWVWKKAPKFFDIVQYTGNSLPNRQISHSLGVRPGLILIKRIDGTADWRTQHITDPFDQNMELNSVNPRTNYQDIRTSSATTFTLVDSGVKITTNEFGFTYIAYLFAHDPSASGIIQCGSYVGNGSSSGPVVSLGWSPQWHMIKKATGSGNWTIFDSARTVGLNDPILLANSDSVESAADNRMFVSNTGFQPISSNSDINSSGQTYIYMAIRKP